MQHGPTERPKLYTELASWWPLVSPASDYEEEAEWIRKVLVDLCARPPRTLLELGCGGGNNASHLKQHFSVTLVDLAPAMLEVSRTLNPECEHLNADMRSVRLNREFDAVLIHDAISYMTSVSDLEQAIETAFMHCRPGGVALFAPDWVRENFSTYTHSGGRDGDGRSLRYLEWILEPEPTGSTYTVELVFLLREDDAPVRVVHDRHRCGLFPRSVWLELMIGVGFDSQMLPFPFSEVAPGKGEIFVGRKLAV
jgi:SAM-dependent methyltransferase